MNWNILYDCWNYFGCLYDGLTHHVMTWMDDNLLLFWGGWNVMMKYIVIICYIQRKIDGKGLFSLHVETVTMLSMHNRRVSINISLPMYPWITKQW